jgi:hypothetical protein
LQDPPKFAHLWYFWSENTPSGNPGAECGRTGPFVLQKPRKMHLAALLLPARKTKKQCTSAYREIFCVDASSKQLIEFDFFRPSHFRVTG